MPPPQISKSSVFLGLGYFSPTTQLKSTIASFPVHLSVTQCVILPQSTSLCLIPTAYVCFLLSGFCCCQQVCCRLILLHTQRLKDVIHCGISNPSDCNARLQCLFFTSCFHSSAHSF